MIESNEAAEKYAARLEMFAASALTGLLMYRPEFDPSNLVHQQDIALIAFEIAECMAAQSLAIGTGMRVVPGQRRSVAFPSENKP